ncbi:MAG: carboxypeptidase regulatory-like domain-containing protein [Sedimentisphaerales bacterium]|nr:carboxypeptidase regulatory-like domain-containing protein [Sedimentisphaerales bacterium]
MSATLRIALALIGLMSSGASTQTTRETGTLAGRVTDAAEKPVVGAAVILCDQASGIPIDSEGAGPFTDEFLAAGRESRPRKNQDNPILYALTDEKGSFRFENVPAGEYRLIAQSWLDADKIERLIEPNGRQIELRGVVEHVRVSAGRTATVRIRPLGNGVLIFDEDMPNDETFLVLSTAPTCADPILGFTGWGGAFMQNMLAANRMPAGETTVSGLPTGTIYFAMFASDSVPGWTDGQVEVRPDTPAVVPEIPFVCAWSNGRHEPPADLKPMVDGFIAMKEQGLTPPEDHPVMQLARMTQSLDFKNAFAYQQWVGQNMDIEFEGPDGEKVKLKDLAAAMQYVTLQDIVAERQVQSRLRREALERFQATRERKRAEETRALAAPASLDIAAPGTFFPSDPEAAKELDDMWAVRQEALRTVPPEEFLEMVRKGLRLTTAKRNDIIKTLGSQFIINKSPCNPLAVDILYAASFEPDLAYDAFYYGLTTAKPKPPHVLDRLVELALDGYNVGRIVWGVWDQRDEFLLRLNSRIRDADPARLLQSRNIVRMLEVRAHNIYSTQPGEIELDKLRRIRDEYSASLDQIRRTLLTGDSVARRTEIERICTERIYMLFDESFVEPVEACADDADPQVRSRVAELAGCYWLWGDTIEYPAITRLLLKLSTDPVPEVRFAAVERGLFNITDRTDAVVKRLIDVALSTEYPVPEDLYPRIGAVLRRSRDVTREVLLAYRNDSQHSRQSVERLYRDALRSELPVAP